MSQGGAHPLPPELAGLVERESGLLVPNRLADAPDPAAITAGPDGTLYDPDGRRLVVFSDQFRRKLNLVLRELNGGGFGVVVGCSSLYPRTDGKPSCGDIMMPVGRDTQDPGFQCKCSRIHWEKAFPEPDRRPRWKRRAG